jgi:hypothetical protein
MEFHVMRVSSGGMILISSLTNVCKLDIVWRETFAHASLYLESYCIKLGAGSSVGIATGYGLDGPGIESGWGRDFSQTSRPALGPTQPPVQRVPGLSRR